MDKAKPIESGCLVLVLSADPDYLVGKIGTATGYASEITARCSVEKRIKTVKSAWCVRFDNTRAWIREDCLMRVDDPDIQQEVMREREKRFVA